MRELYYSRQCPIAVCRELPNSFACLLGVKVEERQIEFRTNYLIAASIIDIDVTELDNVNWVGVAP